MNNFKRYMLENYTHNEMADIAMHGCQSGCASGMIYYTETTALFDKYRGGLFEIMAIQQEEMGYTNTLPDYVQKNSDTFTSFANSVVWFCAEVISYNETQGEYVDEQVETE